MKKKIIISEEQYKRVFLNEQSYYVGPDGRVGMTGAFALPKGAKVISKKEYDIKKAIQDRDDKLINSGLTPPPKSAELALTPKIVNKSTETVEAPTNVFTIAQKQWEKFYAENKKTGRNKIPNNTVSQLKTAWDEAIKNYNIQNPKVDLNDKLLNTQRGDTESGGIASSMKSSGFKWSEYGWTDAKQDKNRNELLKQIEKDIPYLSVIAYNKNIDEQSELIPKYCVKQKVYRWKNEFICDNKTVKCSSVKMDTYVNRAKKYDKNWNSTFGLGWKTPKGLEYGYYLTYRVDIGKDPLELCNNAKSQGVWVYNTQVGYQCLCYNTDSNTKYIDNTGTYTEAEYFGFIENVKRYEEEHDPGFLNSVVDYFGKCFDDYHCVLDLMSIAALAIPGFGVFVSSGLDIINATAYGFEASFAKTVEDRDAAIIAGGLTLLGGIAGGYGPTKNLLKYGNVNPKIFEYASDVYKRINSEIGNVSSLSKITNSSDKALLETIYAETRLKYKLKVPEILVAHDILEVFSKIDPKMAESYMNALKQIDGKLKNPKISKATLVDIFENKSWKQALEKNNGDIILTLQKYMNKPDTRAFLIQVGAFVGVQEVLEIPIVAQYLQKAISNTKYYINQSPRNYIESFSYPWEETQKIFGSNKTSLDNTLLMSAFENGWRPWPQNKTKPTEEDIITSQKLLTTDKFKKYQTEKFKKEILPTIIDPDLITSKRQEKTLEDKTEEEKSEMESIKSKTNVGDDERKETREKVDNALEKLLSDE